MALLRRIARPMLASMFLSGGWSTLRDPAAVADTAAPVATPIAERIKGLPKDPEQLVRINGAVQVGAGVLLALGRAPRPAALLLAGTLVPTTLAAHPYWTVEDPAERARQRIHFFKNLSMLGGLLIAAADTHGKPSLAYRTRSGTLHATASVADHAHRAAAVTENAAESVRDRLRVGA
ncbi:DoxX family protein [Actinacidiphila alni]|nr:DoxX family protein [Actinacidiphila alni]